jgi:uncharacterized protein (DUF4415 family)
MTIRFYANPPRNPKGSGRKPSGKQLVTLRIEPEVLAALRATGPGWQQRANDALRKAVLVSPDIGRAP